MSLGTNEVLSRDKFPGHVFLIDTDDYIIGFLGRVTYFFRAGKVQNAMCTASSNCHQQGGSPNRTWNSV
jgi:hypothetical protein